MSNYIIIQVLRLMRVIRLLKLARHSDQLMIIVNVLKKRFVSNFFDITQFRVQFSTTLLIEWKFIFIKLKNLTGLLPK